MLLAVVLFCALYQAEFINGLYLDKDSLIELQKITDDTLKGLGIGLGNSERPTSERITDPVAAYLLEQQDYKIMCPKIGIRTSRKELKTIFVRPEFQKIYSDCQKLFVVEKSTCFATCIFLGIIHLDEYGSKFVINIKTKDNFYNDNSIPFPHMSMYDFHTHENIFCFSKDYRYNLLSNILACQIPSTTEVCIIDEDHYHCDSKLGYCEFYERDVSVITIGNNAHPLTCGSLDKIEWKYFANSTKFQCVLPRQDKLLNTQRAMFKDCDVCIPQKSGKNNAVIEFPNPPSKEEFAKVAYSGRPIVVRNAINFEEHPPLNFSFVKEMFADNGKMKCKFNTFYSPFKTFEDALSIISDEGFRDYKHSWYLSWQLCTPELQRKFTPVIPSPNFFPDDYPSSLAAWVFVGPPGDGVLAHTDYIKRPTWQAQLSGSKRWIMRSPPECSRVCNKWIRVTVNKGDLFIFEANIWHHGTFVEKGNLSMSITTDYLHPLP